MATTDTASWTRTQKGWQLIIEFKRHWEAPKPGTGLGSVHNVVVLKKGDHLSKRSTGTDLRLTSRVFQRDGKLMAFAEEA